MCGFAGYTPILNASDNKAILNKMLYPIRHRGPDDYSIHVNKSIAIGHHRLSIIDLKNGKQPCIDTKTGNMLVFNGEIYDYKTHAHFLSTNKIRLRNNSDTEVLFQYLQNFGIEQTLSAIDGMFAFAYFQETDRTLWLIRDRAGEKPVYYFYNNEYFLFGSEASSICSHPIMKNRKLNNEALLQYLHLDYIPNEKTIIKHIKKVKPGEIIKFKEGRIRRNKYWKINQTPKHQSTEQENIETVNCLIKESVEKRLVADVPVGVFLSGGIDSSLIAYYTKNINSNIKTFTIKMENDSFDESNYAKETANYLGIKNLTMTFEKKSIMDSIKVVEENLDEPLGDSSILPTFLVSKFAKEHVKVILSGDGADELFSGYQPFKYLKFLNYLKLFPKQGGKIISLLTDNIPFKEKYMGSLFLIKHVSRGLGWPTHHQIFRWMAPLSDSNIRSLLKKEFLYEYTPENYWNLLIPQNLSNKNNINDQITNLFFNFYLPNDILTKVDRASMYNNLEVRSPFLSKSIIEFSMQLNNKFKVKNGKTKHILRELCLNKIPKKIINRKKHGFAIPLSDIIRGPLKEKIQDTLLSSNNNINEYFNKTKLEGLLNKHFNGKERKKTIWSIYILEKTIERLSKC